MVKRSYVCPSVCLDVCLSVSISHESLLFPQLSTDVGSLYLLIAPAMDHITSMYTALITINIVSYVCPSVNV